MNKYHIRIDGKQSTSSYTYQELECMGLFELDADSLNGIEVKKVANKVFKPLKSYCFPERQSNETSYSVDEYGQSTNKNGVYVDEYGQIVRSNNQTSLTISSSSSTSTTFMSNSTESTNTPSTSSSSKNDNDDLSWRIILTIIVLAIGIPILVNIGLEGFWGYFVFVAASCILFSIWD